MSTPAQLHDILRAGSHLLESSSEPLRERNIKSVLTARLENFYVALDKTRPLQVRDTVEDLQLETALCALEVIEHVQSLVDADKSFANEASSSDCPAAASGLGPAFGSRDLAQLRTLLSMVFRWGVNPLLARVSVFWPSPARASIAEPSVSHISEDYRSLRSLLTRLATILLPCGVHGNFSWTVITASVLDYHIVDYFRAAMALGWLPKSLGSENMHSVDELRPVVLRLLDL